MLALLRVDASAADPAIEAGYMSTGPGNRARIPIPSVLDVDHPGRLGDATKQALRELAHVLEPESEIE
jgi:hypothetical protein